MHYSTYVIAPRSTTDIVAEVTRLLAGSEADPAKEFPTYQQPCYCLGIIATTESWRALNSSPEGQRLADDLAAARERGDREAKEQLLRTRWRRKNQLERDHDAYGRPDPDCDTCQGSGCWARDRDPRSQWDWWVIGGRWSGRFGGREGNGREMPEPLAGNVALIDEEIMAHVPAAIVTPDGYWYEGPSHVASPWQPADELDPWVRDHGEAWRLLAGYLLRRHQGEIVVLVDCHN